MSASDTEHLIKRACPTTIISGGQTGADRAALEVAQLLGIRTGGLAPPGFMTSAGKDPELKYKFSLSEMHFDLGITMNVAYVLRSKSNVNASDATLVFRLYPSPSTDKTIGYCLTRQWKTVALESIDDDAHVHRPVLIISDSVQNSPDISAKIREEDKQRLCAFILRHNVKTLNVTGHHQNPSTDPTWQERITNFLMFALEN